ncbi:MAG: hypothetical protein ACYSSP_09940 [Planctomycetota bacterium]|jgi:hypothetical protein
MIENRRKNDKRSNATEKRRSLIKGFWEKIISERASIRNAATLIIKNSLNFFLSFTIARRAARRVNVSISDMIGIPNGLSFSVIKGKAMKLKTIIVNR